MKAKMLLLLIFVSSVTLGQTYSYSKKKVIVSVQTSNGNEYRTLNTYQGPYKFVFQNSGDKLFTLLKPNEDLRPGQQWYGFIKDSGYSEKNGIIYKKSIYLYTGTNEQVMVLISTDFNKIIIFNQDDSIWEFSD